MTLNASRTLISHAKDKENGHESQQCSEPVPQSTENLRSHTTVRREGIVTRRVQRACRQAQIRTQKHTYHRHSHAAVQACVLFSQQKKCLRTKILTTIKRVKRSMRPEVLWVNYGRSPCRRGYEFDANDCRVPAN